MNLNYAYDSQSLTNLAASASKNLSLHNLVIDYDGEVIIDPELHFANVPLEKYKFSTVIEDKCLRSHAALAALYDALEHIFNSFSYSTMGERHGDSLMRLAA